MFEPFRVRFFSCLKSPLYKNASPLCRCFRFFQICTFDQCGISYWFAGSAPRSYCKTKFGFRVVFALYCGRIWNSAGSGPSMSCVACLCLCCINVTIWYCVLCFSGTDHRSQGFLHSPVQFALEINLCRQPRSMSNTSVFPIFNPHICLLLSVFVLLTAFASASSSSPINVCKTKGHVIGSCWCLRTAIGYSVHLASAAWRYWHGKQTRNVPLLLCCLYAQLYPCLVHCYLKLQCLIFVHEAFFLCVNFTVVYNSTDSW